MLPLLLSLAEAREPTLRLTAGHPLHYAVELTLNPAAESFSGTVDIEVDLGNPRSNLLLNGHGLKVTRASLYNGTLNLGAMASVVDSETLRFSWGKKVGGTAHLRVQYEGKVDAVDSQGLFHQREGDDWYLLSQFEETDARRAFPCFDQPEFKTPWQMTVHAPAGLAVFNNALAVSDTPDASGHTVVFAETRPLPSYLVAVAVGPFDVVDAGTAGRNHVPVRIAVPKGRGGDTAWARKTTAPILESLEAWTGLAYPYSKLDVVSIPQAVGFGAMENAGMVTIVQGAVVVKPEDETLGFHRSYSEIMAHELAHQWFGDLVTPSWWTDIWLNESFASWFGTKAVDQLWPEWRMDVDRVNSRAGVMEADTLASSRQVRQPVNSYDDIRNAFDGITYAKGEAVLEMLERHVGPAKFQAGVRQYLRDHAYGNATAEDFVGAISKAAGQDITPIYRSFVEQPGVPLVEVKLNCEGAPHLELSQARLLGTELNHDQTWSIPFCVRYEGSEGFCTVVDQPTASLPLPGATTCPAWVIPNAGAAGYFRVKQDFSSVLAKAPLSRTERLSVVRDADALIAAGQLEPGVLLQALPALLARNEPELTGATVGVVSGLSNHLVPEDLRPNYARFVRSIYGELAWKLGFNPNPSDDPMTRRLRPRVVSLVADEGQDPELRRQARVLADQWLRDRSGVDPEMVGTVLSLAAIEGDAALFETMKAAALAEKDRARRGRILDAMGAFRRPEQVEQGLALALSKQLDIREAFGLFFGPLGQPASRQMLWDYARQHFGDIEPQIPGMARGYLPYLGSAFCDLGHRGEVQTFFEPRAKKWLGGPRILAQVLESVDVCIATTSKQQPAVRAFLEAVP